MYGSLDLATWPMQELSTGTVRVATTCSEHESYFVIKEIFSFKGNLVSYCLKSYSRRIMDDGELMGLREGRVYLYSVVQCTGIPTCTTFSRAKLWLDFVPFLLILYFYAYLTDNYIFSTMFLSEKMMIQEFGVNKFRFIRYKFLVRIPFNSFSCKLAELP